MGIGTDTWILFPFICKDIIWFFKPVNHRLYGPSDSNRIQYLQTHIGRVGVTADSLL
jgi:hypothetical protein